MSPIFWPQPSLGGGGGGILTACSTNSQTAGQS